MKNFKNILVCGLVALLLSGCSGLLKSRTVPQVQVIPSSTNIVREITQAPPTVTVVTQVVAGASTVVTNYVPSAPVTNFFPVYVPGKTVTNLQVVGYDVGDKVTSAIDTARTVNAVVPTPYSPLVEGALGLLTAAATAYAAFKTKQLKKSEGVNESLVGAVETFGTPAQKSANLKEHITLTAVANGNAADVSNAKRAVVGGS